MNKTLLFYDLETSGLSKSFDQILQYAAIRVNESFEVIDEIELKIRTSQGLLPSPEAMLIHGIGIDDYHDQMCEMDAIFHIHQLHNVPGTISGGYNTLGFDDEFLRFSFIGTCFIPIVINLVRTVVVLMFIRCCLFIIYTIDRRLSGPWLMSVFR